MKILKAYRFELRTNPAQEASLRRFVGCCRFVWNKALAEQRERYASEGQKLGYAGLCRQLTAWKQDEALAFLKEAPIHPLQQSLKDLERAYRNFFEKRAAFPRFKKKGEHEAFRYPDPQQFTVDSQNGRVKLPKLGWLRYRKSRDVIGAPNQITVSLEAGKWFVSIQCAVETADPAPPDGGPIGIDMGVVNFATLSDGTAIVPLNSFRRQEKRLAKAQRELSRKKKGSANRKKAKAKVDRLSWSVANARRDFLHKTSTMICKNHAIVVIEDLKVKNMSASAKGSTEDPGRNVKQKAGLNKSILDQGWGLFRQMLGYKSIWLGGLLLAIDPANTSRTCHECGTIDKENRVTQAQFQCTHCGHRDHADVNAARNILRAGLARLACPPERSGGSRARGSKSDCGLLAGTDPATCKAGNHRALVR